MLALPHQLWFGSDCEFHLCSVGKVYHTNWNLDHKWIKLLFISSSVLYKATCASSCVWDMVSSTPINRNNISLAYCRWSLKIVLLLKNAPFLNRRPTVGIKQIKFKGSIFQRSGSVERSALHKWVQSIFLVYFSILLFLAESLWGILMFLIQKAAKTLTVHWIDMLK